MPLPALRRPFIPAVALIVAAVATAQGPDDRGFDPTGLWMGQHGPLALMRAGDTLSFSYSAVFGATAHLCDGLGVAGFVGDGRWEYVDEQGTVSFTTRDGRVTMQVTAGIASFCGANWPGETLVEERWKPAFRCRVTRAKAHFHVVGTLPPDRRKAFVVEGRLGRGDRPGQREFGRLAADTLRRGQPDHGGPPRTRRPRVPPGVGEDAMNEDERVTTRAASEVARVLDNAPFIAALGLELESITPGACVTTLPLADRHLQQDGFVHAGVQATMADHTAGAAASSLVPEGCFVLTSGFTINLLRATRGERLVCRAKVLKAGRQVTVVESEVFCIAGADETLVSKAVVTLAVVARPT